MTQRADMRTGCRIVIALAPILLGLLCICATQVFASSVTRVVFTTDVCWICGNDFYGNFQGRDYGVPFIVDRLSRHGMKGTFFVSPFCPENLKENLKRNMEFLIKSGHDIQFHPHPDVCNSTRENLTDYTRAEKQAIYSEGIEALVKMGAPRPIAFRAGCYAIDQVTLDLLPSLGIMMDSSIFPPDSRSKVPLPRDLANRFVKIGGVYELPITLIQILPYLGYDGMTALDLDRTIWEEQKTALDQLASHHVPLVQVFMHFHTFYECEENAQPFEPLRVTGACRENIVELDAMLAMLAKDPRFEVVTVKDVWDIFQKNPQALVGPAFIPYTGIRLTYKRAWRHFFGHGIKNKIFVLSPIVSLVVVALLITALVRRLTG